MKTIVKVRKSFEWEGITIRLATVAKTYSNLSQPMEYLMAIAPNNGVIKNDFVQKCTLKRAQELTIEYLNTAVVLRAGLATAKEVLTQEIAKDNKAYCHENK